MVKACIDTNVWLSNIVFSGAPAEIITLAFKKKFHVVTSDFILEEVEWNLVKKIRCSVEKSKVV